MLIIRLVIKMIPRLDNFEYKVCSLKQFSIIILILFFSSPVFSQQAPEGLFIASRAPDFKATDQYNQEIKLKDLLKKGKVVLVFYRGQWCPYCNRQLKKLEDSLQLIKDKGATLVAVSPEKPESIKATVEKTKASYPILYDEGLKIMKAYDVEFELSENTLTRYRNTGIKVEENNGKNGKYLPVPAVYIIDQESTVTYRYFEQDYKKRPSVLEILNNL